MHQLIKSKARPMPRPRWAHAPAALQCKCECSFQAFVVSHKSANSCVVKAQLGLGLGWVSSALRCWIARGKGGEADYAVLSRQLFFSQNYFFQFYKCNCLFSGVISIVQSAATGFIIYNNIYMIFCVLNFIA